MKEVRECMGYEFKWLRNPRDRDRERLGQIGIQKSREGLEQWDIELED